MFILHDDKIDHVVTHWKRCLLASLIVFVVVAALPRDLKTGVFSGFMLLSLGIYGWALRRWRSEPGVWMLAALLVLLLGPICIAFEYSHWQSVFARNPNRFTWKEMRVSIDAIVALDLLFECVRFAFSVAVKNWKYTGPKKPANF